jgi:hypothetical protein
MELRVEFFNIFNHAYFLAPGGDFGQVDSVWFRRLFNSAMIGGV